MTEKFPIYNSENKTSGIDRIVGVSQEDEAGIKDYFSYLFEMEGVDSLCKDPNLEFREVFSEINTNLQEFLRSYGIEPLDIPLSRISILDKEQLSPKQREYIERETTNAFYHPASQQIVIYKDWNEGSKLAFLQKLVHEMIHMQAFESWQKVTEENKNEQDLILGKGDEEIHLGLRRLGFRIRGRDQEKLAKLSTPDLAVPLQKSGDNKTVYFYDIDEAITTELTMRFDWKYFGTFPQLSEEIKEREEAILAFVERNNSSQEEERRHIAEIESKQLEDGRVRSNLKGYSYDKERKKLMLLCEDIYKQNTKQLSSSEDVFNEFVKAAMTGRLLPIARIIEHTYGKGSFRSIGEETSQKESSDIA